MRRIGACLTVLVLLACGTASAQEGFEALKEQCIACHGESGHSEIPETPSLGGIDDYYALLQLVAFRAGNRKNETMNEIASAMTDNDLRAASAWIDGCRGRRHRKNRVIPRK